MGAAVPATAMRIGGDLKARLAAAGRTRPDALLFKQQQNLGEPASGPSRGRGEPITAALRKGTMRVL
jgi:hypothetical protein